MRRQKKYHEFNFFSIYILETNRLNCGTLSYQYKDEVSFVFVINVNWCGVICVRG